MSEYLEYHRSLLADSKRTHAYRQAIRQVVKPGDVVVDLGSGSGILAFFAAEAGARHVYAIDHSHMADFAEFLSGHLGFADRITVLHAPSPKVALPEPADVLVTETMGAAGIDEGMLGFVLEARPRMLRPGATIVPGRIALHAAPVQIDADYERLVAWWSKPRYGFDFTPLRGFASNGVHLVHIDPRAHLATGTAVIDLDLATFDSDVVRGEATFRAKRDGLLHGFATWFEATLAGSIKIHNRETRGSHWSQAFLPLETPIAVRRGARIHVDIESDDGRAWRWQGSAAGEAFDQSSWAALPPCDVSPLD